MSDKTIDFLIAGVQKGGTTALYEYLRQLPQISMAVKKEVHFFDNEDLNWNAPDYRIYHQEFEPFDGRIRGEATPIYIYWPNSLNRIAKYNPRMKLILIFRDPVERAWSQWRMEKARDFDDADFSWAIRDGRRRLAGDTASPGHHRIYSYVERGFYGEQLENLLAIFPQSQILLLQSEHLKLHPTETLRSVAEFLDLEGPPPIITPSLANVGSSVGQGAISASDAEYLRRLYHDDLLKFAGLSSWDVSPWLED